MEVYKIGPATVRIHGKVDREKLTEATTIYMKKVEARRKKGGSGEGGNANKEHSGLCSKGA